MKGERGTGSTNLNMYEEMGQSPVHYHPLKLKLQRVAILGSLPPLRALSSYCLELALAIADLGKVEFISFKKIYPAIFYPGGDLKEDHTFPVIKHRNLKVWRRLTWYNPLSWIYEGLSPDADLLHAQWWSPPLTLTYLFVCLGFKLRKRPIVFTVHNVLQHEKASLYDILSRILFSLCDHFIVHSGLNKRQLVRHFNILPEMVTQIPHGPLDFHVRGDTDRDQVRKEMGFEPRDRVILLFGAIRPYKGIDTALKAFSKVLQKIPEARLLIAGKLWEDWEPYERLVQDLEIGDKIKTCLRYIASDEVCNFFEVSDLVILPYHHFDSQSGVGATAISFRKPMIVTMVGGLPELVMDQDCVVPPMDPDALSLTVVRCLRDPAMLARMATGAEKIDEKIAWPAIARKTWEVYTKVLALKKTPGKR